MLPIAHVTSQLVNMLLTFIVVFAALIISGKGLNPIALIYLPIVIFAEYLLAISLTMIVSSITVYFRDLEHILAIFTMAWQFLTPIMYSIDMVPKELLPIFNLNPMTPIIVAYRDILYYKQIPHIKTLLHGYLISIFLMVIGWIVFGKLKKHFAEEM